MKFIAKIFILILLINLNCCNTKNKKNDELENLIYDKSKLSLEIVDRKLGIKFNQPVKWQLKQPDFSRKVESYSKNINTTEKKFIYNPVYFFFNDSTKSILSVGFIEYPDSLTTLSDKLAGYKELIRKKYESYDLELSEYSQSRIQFSKFKYEIGYLINYKIVFASKKSIITFDFTLLKSNYDKEINFVKAVLSSIELIN